MVTCPKCQYSNFKLIGPGYYECLTEWRQHIMHPQLHYAVGEDVRRCRERVREGSAVDKSQMLCPCGELYGWGTCKECQRWVCSDHSRREGLEFMCGDCLHRTDAATAYGTYQPILRAPADIASCRDPAERAVRWCSFARYVKDLPIDFDVAAKFQELFPADAQAGRTQPSWNTASVVAWFLKKAESTGVKPDTSYRRIIKKNHWYFGPKLVYGPEVLAWHLPFGSADQALKDAYVLPDGTVLLPSDIQREEQQTNLNANALASMADILYLLRLGYREYFGIPRSMG